MATKTCVEKGELHLFCPAPNGVEATFTLVLYCPGRRRGSLLVVEAFGNTRMGLRTLGLRRRRHESGSRRRLPSRRRNPRCLRDRPPRGPDRLRLSTAPGGCPHVFGHP